MVLRCVIIPVMTERLAHPGKLTVKKLNVNINLFRFQTANNLSDVLVWCFDTPWLTCQQHRAPRSARSSLCDSTDWSWPCQALHPVTHSIILRGYILCTARLRSAAGLAARRVWPWQAWISSQLDRNVSRAPPPADILLCTVTFGMVSLYFFNFEKVSLQNRSWCSHKTSLWPIFERSLLAQVALQVNVGSTGSWPRNLINGTQEANLDAALISLPDADQTACRPIVRNRREKVFNTEVLRLCRGGPWSFVWCVGGWAHQIPRGDGTAIIRQASRVDKRAPRRMNMVAQHWAWLKLSSGDLNRDEDPGIVSHSTRKCASCAKLPTTSHALIERVLKVFSGRGIVFIKKRLVRWAACLAWRVDVSLPTSLNNPDA